MGLGAFQQKMGKSLASVNVRIGASLEGLEKGLKQAERSFKRTAKKINATADSLNRNITLPLVAAAGAGVKLAVELGVSFNKIENLVGVTGESLEKFKKGVAGLSGPLAKSQSELSRALFTITSAGERGADALKILEKSAKASKIGLGDTNAIAKTTTAVLQAYGKENYNASKAVNVLTKIVREGNLEASSLAPVLGNIIGLASTMGVSFEEVGASIATFTRLGVGAEEAVTGLQGLLGGMLKPSKEGRAALAQYGISFDDLRKSVKERGLALTMTNLMDLFRGNEEALTAVIPNIRALRTALGTAGVQGESYAQILKSISSETDIVDEGFKKVSESAAFKFEQSMVQLRNIGIDIGAKLLPVLLQLTQHVQKAMTAFSGLDDSTKMIIIRMGAFAAAMGPVLKVLAGVINSLGVISGAMVPVIGGVKKLHAATLGLTRIQVGMWLGAVAVNFVAIGVAIYGTVKAFEALRDKITGTTRASRKMQGAINDVNREFAIEKMKADELFATLKDVSKSTEERQEALDKLNGLYPKYLSSLSIEKSTITEIGAAQKNVNDELLKGIALRKKEELLAPTLERMVDIELELKKINKEGYEGLSWLEQWNEDLFGFNRKAGETSKQFAVRAKIESLTAEMGKLREEADLVNETFDETFGVREIKRSRGIGASGETKHSVKVSTTTTDDSGGIIGTIGARLKEFNKLEVKPLKALENDMTKLSLQVKPFTEDMGLLSEEMQRQADKAENWKNALESLKEGIANILESGLENVAIGVGEALGSVAAGVGSLQDVGRAALAGIAGMLIDVGKLAIKTGIAISGIKLALESLNPGIAIAGGIALVALGSMVKSKLSASVPKLAKGGLAFGPTSAVVGDNMGAIADPEVISPLSKLQGMLQPMIHKAIAGHGGGASSVNLNGIFRISGRDLKLVLDQELDRLNRTGG